MADPYSTRKPGRSRSRSYITVTGETGKHFSSRSGGGIVLGKSTYATGLAEYIQVYFRQQAVAGCNQTRGTGRRGVLLQSLDAVSAQESLGSREPLTTSKLASKLLLGQKDKRCLLSAPCGIC